MPCSIHPGDLQRSVLELSTASVVDSVWVFCEFSVVADPDPLHAVRDNAAQRVIIDINVLFVFINNCSFK